MSFVYQVTDVLAGYFAIDIAVPTRGTNAFAGPSALPRPRRRRYGSPPPTRSEYTRVQTHEPQTVAAHPLFRLPNHEGLSIVRGDDHRHQRSRHHVRQILPQIGCVGQPEITL